MKDNLQELQESMDKTMIDMNKKMIDFVRNAIYNSYRTAVDLKNEEAIAQVEQMAKDFKFQDMALEIKYRTL